MAVVSKANGNNFDDLHPTVLPVIMTVLHTIKTICLLLYLCNICNKYVA